MQRHPMGEEIFGECLMTMSSLQDTILSKIEEILKDHLQDAVCSFLTTWHVLAN